VSITLNLALPVDPSKQADIIDVDAADDEVSA
jgi:hypothetical protein